MAGVELGELFQETEAPTTRQNLLDRFKTDITETVMKSLEAFIRHTKNSSRRRGNRQLF